MFRHLRNISRCIRLCGSCQRVVASRSAVGGMVLLAAGVSVDDNQNDRKLEINTDQLSPSYLIKMASVQMVNSATTLLTQSVTVLLDTMDTYVELLQALVQLMELQLQVFGNDFREEKVWDAIMDVRRQINECKMKKQELEAIFHSAEKSLQAAGDAAHITGAVYAGVAANERVFSATSQLQQKELLVESAEHALHLVEAECIKKMGKKGEETKQNLNISVTEDETLPPDQQEMSSSKDHTTNKSGKESNDDNTVIMGDNFEKETYARDSEDFFFK